MRMYEIPTSDKRSRIRVFPSDGFSLANFSRVYISHASVTLIFIKINKLGSRARGVIIFLCEHLKNGESAHF